MFYPLYPKVLQALKSFPNFVAVYLTVEQVGLVIPGFVWVGLSVCLYVSFHLSVLAWKRAPTTTGRC